MANKIAGSFQNLWFNPLTMVLVSHTAIFESLTRERGELQRKENLSQSGNGRTANWPRIRYKRMTRAGFLWVTETMFPRYLFARFTLAEMHRRVRHTLGISGIVQFGDHYPTIEDRALAHLRDHTGGEIKELDYELSKGNQVKIVSGAFVGLEAVITHVLPAKRRVIILMDFLGRKVEAELECSCIAPQQNRLLAEVSTPDPLYEQSGYTPIAHL